MSLVSVLKTYGQIGVNLLRQAIASQDATGKTAASIRFVVQENKGEEALTFYARQYFDLLEKGIRPSSKRPSKEMIESMTEYARARGFANPEKAAWAISIKQLAKGDTTHRQGGRILYSDDMNTFVKELGRELAEEYGKDLAGQYKNAFK